jgi:hypothetical protein
LQDCCGRIQRWKEDPRIVGYVHDQDAKATKAIRDAGWQIREYIDLNHLVNSNFARLFESYNCGRDKNHRASRRLLYGVKGKLETHLKWSLLDASLSSMAERKAKWLEAYDHLVNHSDWKERNEAESQRALRGFLDAMAEQFDRCQPQYRTQVCSRSIQ